MKFKYFYFKKGTYATVRLLTFLCLALVSMACHEDRDETAAFFTSPRHAVGDELVQNGDFSAGAANWFLGQWGATTSGRVVNGHYVITVSSAGTQWWHSQFNQGRIPLAEGRRYTLSFDAWKGAENGGTQQMQINIGEDGGDYTGYMNLPNQIVDLTTQVAHYSFTFDMIEPNDGAARVEFNCGKFNGTYHLDNVSLTEVSNASGLVLDSVPVSLSAVITESATASFGLTNASADSIQWSVQSDVPWLSVSPASGNMAPGSNVQLMVAADATNLTAGTYETVVSVTHSATNIPSPVDVPVEFVVIDGYQPQSEYILNPETNIDFVKSIAAFRTRGRDDVNGGFYTNLDRQGYPTTQNEKSMCGQSRLAYAFVRAFMLTGNEIWLDHARHALAFLYSHAYNNGWYLVTDVAGNYVPHWGHNDWWSFQQHYAMVGITAMVEATGGNLNWNDGAGTDLSWLETGLWNLDTHLWDGNAATKGYFNKATTNWSTRWDKGFTPTVDAVTTHAALLGLMSDDPARQTRLLDLADNILDHLYGSMSISGAGWPEMYNSNWSVQTGSRVTDVGHVYKTAWVLNRIYLRNRNRPALRDAAREMMWDMWEHGGYDHVNGGPFSQLYWDTGVVFNRNKDHWMLEQGVTSGLINYYVAESQTDRDMYLQVADGSMRFYMEHQVDHQYGDVFDKVSEDGNSVVAVLKGGLFNGGYHAVELGYYTYLYASLYYHHSPVRLYYKFPVASSERHIRLTPVAIEDELLKILSVSHNGSAYGDFVADTRELILPAGEGGVFQVTFGTQSACGDGVCSASEDCSSCEADCGSCEYCGDGVCGASEDCSSCEADCGSCEYCGDGVCSDGETCETCASDCGTCPVNHCTCPSGCDNILNATAPFSADGIANSCYFLGNLGTFVNSWNSIEVNVNGIDITNVYLGNWRYPATLDGGYYLYYHSGVPWGHVEVR